MRKKYFGMVTASSALLMALCVVPGGAVAEASAQEYDLMGGSITVTAKADGKQYVTQAGGVSDELQTSDTLITQSDADMTANTITLAAEADQAAEVTFQWVNIDVSEDGKAAVSTSGKGDVTITLLKSNVVKSGDNHAGLEKGNTGNLTVKADNADQHLYATGGEYGAGIGGGHESSVSDITVAGGTVKATGGYRAAGIGAGWVADGSNACSNITVSGGVVTAKGGWGAAGIGGSFGGAASDISITGGTVTARGGVHGAGIGGGSNDNGTGISISGGKVTAAGGPCAAGIGGGLLGNGSDVTVSGTAQLKVQGGSEFSRWGAGAGIGNGGYENGGDRAAGAEVDPDTKELSDGGEIEYFNPGADMTSASSSKTISEPQRTGGFLRTLLAKLLGRS